ncbi:MAG: long-chain fatty acid--CoA ligase [Bacteroidales bacterium]|nr:long-chain fatty acid--CoA ligase [Bacteroidales bacterium]
MNNSDINHTISSLFRETVKRAGNSNALAYAGEKPMTWSQVDTHVKALMAMLGKAGIRPGDRVVLLSTNMPNWGIAYFAITFSGAVVVPVLPDFSAVEIMNVIDHSGAAALFVSSSLYPKVEENKDKLPGTIILTDDFSVIRSTDEGLFFELSAKPVTEHNVLPDDLAAIIYTSGTTGKSKGVMLTHKNITFNALKGRKIHYLDENDRFLSVLPLSHTYENTLGLILPMLCGSCIYYLRKPPSPAILLPALAQVKPTAMLTVPLIIEKIYFNRILPSFSKNALLRILYSKPFFRKRLNAIAGKKLLKTFGGCLRFYGIGGAKLKRNVEEFLREAHFPYAIGYGLTETSPLLAGCGPSNTVLESTGPAIEGIELIIHNPDPETGEGEIWARGPNVMKGYYREPGLTAEVLTEEGWFRTGDLGRFDESGNLFIKGRLKNMIVGSSGENIYPEEIESIINNFEFVSESIVVEQKGRLVALVHLNMEELEKKYQHLKHDLEAKIEELKTDLKNYVNSKVNRFSQISKIEHHETPFQKTATQKIKRFLYKEKEAPNNQ